MVGDENGESFFPLHWININLSFYLEKAMAPHSSTLAWKVPWTEEPGRLQSMGSWRVGHYWSTSLSRLGEGNGSLLQCSCLGTHRDGGAWWAAIYGVAQSRTRLKWLSSSELLLPEIEKSTCFTTLIPNFPVANKDSHTDSIKRKVPIL